MRWIDSHTANKNVFSLCLNVSTEMSGAQQMFGANKSMYSVNISTKRCQLRSATILHCVKKQTPALTVPSYYNKSWNVLPFTVKMLKEDCSVYYYNKCSKNDVPLHGHKPGDIFSVHQSTILCVVHQTRSYSDTAAVIF